MLLFSDVSLISVRTAAAALRRGLLSTVTAQGRDTAELRAITVRTSGSDAIARASSLSIPAIEGCDKNVKRVIPRNQAIKKRIWTTRSQLYQAVKALPVKRSAPSGIHHMGFVLYILYLLGFSFPLHTFHGFGSLSTRRNSPET